MYRRISFLAERDALSLITEPLADRVIYPAGVPERIIRLTAGQPFYTQVVCQNLIDGLNEMGRDRVRQAGVDAVAQKLADNPLPQMIYFWDGLEQDQRNALARGSMSIASGQIRSACGYVRRTQSGSRRDGCSPKISSVPLAAFGTKYFLRFPCSGSRHQTRCRKHDGRPFLSL